MEISPCRVFAPERVRVLVANVSFTRVPLPYTLPDRVWAALDEYSNTAPLAMLTDVPEPTKPPPAICSVPAPMVITPA